MKIKFVFLCLVIAALSVSAQQSASDEFYGKGTGRNERAADNNAIKELVSQIADKYISGFTGVGNNLLDEPGNDKDAVIAVINTYINYIQNISEREVLSQSPTFSIKRSLSATAVEQMFDSRRVKMEDMLNSASKAEQAGKIDDALRYYNWSYYLLQSLPDYTAVTMNGNKLVDWVPSRIEDILAKVSFAISKKESNNVVLDVTYCGKHVTSLDYIYFDGKDWSGIFSAKDGIGILDFSSKVPDDIQVKCECNYLSEAHIDKDVNLLVDVLCGPVIKGDIKSVSADVPAVSGLSYNQEEKLSDDSEGGNTLLMLSADESLPFRKRIDKVLAAIGSGKYSSVEDLFSLDGFDIFNKLISYGKARIVGDVNTVSFMASNDEVICRSIPMSFSFSNNNRKFVENVVFTFNADTLIDNISFGLDQQAADEILYEHSSWSEYARKILIEFLENYKTAYALKRIDYLRQVFRDDALIIVGKVSERPSQNADDEQKYIDNKFVQLYRKSKEEYMEQLERCFNSNEFINIRFSENDILKAGKGNETYGIQIKQDYYSSNYGDTGYLFLMVDLNDPKQPVISVRVWMPERDPDFDGLFSF